VVLNEGSKEGASSEEDRSEEGVEVVQAGIVEEEAEAEAENNAAVIKVATGPSEDETEAVDTGPSEDETEAEVAAREELGSAGGREEIESDSRGKVEAAAPTGENELDLCDDEEEEAVSTRGRAGDEAGGASLGAVEEAVVGDGNGAEAV